MRRVHLFGEVRESLLVSSFPSTHRLSLFHLHSPPVSLPPPLIPRLLLPLLHLALLSSPPPPPPPPVKGTHPRAHQPHRSRRWTPESVGDYASGTNHVLPTYGFARMYSGVSLDSFQTKITVQNLSEEGLKGLGPHVAKMAAVEGLDAHRLAVTARLESLQ